MGLILAWLERRLWPTALPIDARVPRWLALSRYSYALLRDFIRGELSLRAMSLVYTTMIAIVPLLAFSFSILTALGLHRELGPVLANFFAPLGDARANELTQRVITFVDNLSSSAVLSVSIVALVLSALSMAQKVEGSFNFVWRVDRPRSFARRFAEYLSVMIAGPIFVSVAMGFTASLASTTVVNRVQQIEPLGRWLAVLSSLTPYALVTAAFSFLYVFVPNTRVNVRPAVLGGLFAGVIWAATGRLFTSVIVSVSRYEAIYSGFAIVLVAMLWLYLSWLILLLGAQLAFYLQNPDYLRLGQRTEVMSNSLRERLALNAMLLVGRDFDEPGHGWRVESLAASIRIARHLLDPIVASLMNAGLLAKTNENRLMPARDPRKITVCEILDAVRNADRDPHHAPGSDWNTTVRELSDKVDAAIHDALGSHSLADIVDADRRAERGPLEDAAARRAPDTVS